MKKVFLIIPAIILMCSFCFASTTVPGGNVSGSWTLAGSPYLVQGAIMIPNGSTLTIEPGVMVNFQGAYKLYVQGRLLAIGAVADTITFTAADTTVGWIGIQFANTPITNDTSKCYYCKLEYCKTNIDGGAFYFVGFSKAIVSNCRISNCKINSSLGGTVDCEGSNPIITKNNISNNSATNGGGIYCTFCSPTITNNIISNNTASRGGGIYCEFSSPIIFNNIISHNNAANQGGGIFCTQNSSVISNNIISNNSASDGGGICFANNGTPSIINNVISNNSAINGGGGIYCDYTYEIPAFTNNTISNNSAAKGGALFCSLYSSVILHNTILWGNTASASGQQVYLDDENSDPNFYYCDVQGGAAFGLNGSIFYTGIYQNNIDTVPLFVAPSAGSGTGYNGISADWSLLITSPCINAGTTDTTGLGLPAVDIFGNPRIRGGRIDIGAYEYLLPNSIDESLYSFPMNIYPNPTTNKLTIVIGQKCEIEIINSVGEIIKTAYNNGKETIIDLENLSCGVYIIKAKTDTGIALKKFIKE